MFIVKCKLIRIFHFTVHRIKHFKGKHGISFLRGMIFLSHTHMSSHRVWPASADSQVVRVNRVKEGSKRLESQAYWAVVKQHQLGDSNVDPDPQTLVVEHVVNLQEMEQLLLQISTSENK